MKISKGKVFIIGLLIILAATNIIFYSKYKIEKEKNNIAQEIATRLAISSSNYYEPLQEYENFKDKINWPEIMGEIDNKKTSAFGLDNYLAVEYTNGNTLMIELAPGNKGYDKIQSMFFLNADTIKNLELYTQSSNKK